MKLILSLFSSGMSWLLPANSALTPLILSYSLRQNQEACLRILVSYTLTTCPSHICAETSYRVLVIFEIRGIFFLYL